MSTFYSDLATEVDGLLAALGTPVVYQRNAYTVDIVEGTSVPSVAAQQSLNTLFIPKTEKGVENLDISFMDGVLDTFEKKIALVSTVGATFRPEPKDEVMLKGLAWQVVGCTPIDPTDEQPVLFVVGLVKP
jgi:hypothetical protein